MWQVNESGWGTCADAAQHRFDVASAGMDHLLRVIDEIDYGILVIDAQGQILQANHLARHELLDRSPAGLDQQRAHRAQHRAVRAS